MSCIQENICAAFMQRTPSILHRESCYMYEKVPRKYATLPNLVSKKHRHMLERLEKPPNASVIPTLEKMFLNCKIFPLPATDASLRDAMYDLLWSRTLCTVGILPVASSRLVLLEECWVEVAWLHTLETASTYTISFCIQRRYFDSYPAY